MSTLVHGTCVAFGTAGILLRGPSGSGKSDLALRLIAAGASLVADDQVMLDDVGDSVIACAPPALAGLLEVRGLGIVRMTPGPPVRLWLVADLSTPDGVARMPEPVQWETRIGSAESALAHLVLAPFEASAVAKLKLALDVAQGRTPVLR